MHLKQLIANYLDYIKFEQNKSNSTLSSYKLYLSKFYGFTGNITTKKIDYALLKQFIRNQHKTACVATLCQLYELPTLDKFRTLDWVGIRKELEKMELFV